PDARDTPDGPQAPDAPDAQDAVGGERGMIPRRHFERRSDRRRSDRPRSDVRSDDQPSERGPSEGRQSERRQLRHAQRVSLAMVGAVAAVLVGVALIDAATPSPAVPAAITPVAAIAPVDAQSSSWYCVGGGNTAGQGHFAVVFTNVSSQAVQGTMTVVGTSGPPHVTAVSIAPHSENFVGPPAGVSGKWLAARVDLSGGGVAVAQTVQGNSGWSQVPCVTSTSTNWYFASGSTSGGRSLATEVYNPTTTTAVVNLSFVTTSGVVQPEPYQGIVLPPGALVVESVGSLVQNRDLVATTVTTKSGRVVASVLEADPKKATSGLSLSLGASSPERHWVIPSTTNAPGSTVLLDVLNPNTTTEHVTVSFHLPAGPVSPISANVAGGAVWQLALSSQTRIPASVDYVTKVQSDGGGVVVGRTIQASAGAAPRSGTFSGIETPSEQGQGSGSNWLLFAPGAATNPVVPQARVAAIEIANPGTSAVTATVEDLGAQGFSEVAHGTQLSVPAGGLRVFEPSSLTPLTFQVLGSGPLVVSEDLQPTATPGVVNVQGIPTG
ncbi:MAG TPA: DUF5719 family protein, partial [Acidimicrobiales bacterium]|nr:DUF5719 family protein [Acidimicrobiales bacterium]